MLSSEIPATPIKVEIIAKIVEPIEALSFHILGIAFIENIFTCPSPSI